MTATAQKNKVLIWQDECQIEQFKSKIKAIASELRSLNDMHTLSSLDDLFKINEQYMKDLFMKQDPEAAKVGELVGIEKIKLPDRMTYILHLAKDLQFELKPNRITGFNLSSFFAIKDGKVITNDRAIETHCDKFRRFAQSEGQRKRLKAAQANCDLLNGMHINETHLAKWKTPFVLFSRRQGKWLINVQFVLDGSGLGAIPEIRQEVQELEASGALLTWPVEGPL